MYIITFEFYRIMWAGDEITSFKTGNRKLLYNTL
jgi:hypothetical protein